MGKIKKTICDNCGRELFTNETYFNANIIRCSEGTDMADVALKGEYCQKCFKNLIYARITIKIIS